MTREPDFSWMWGEAVYEPAPVPRTSRRRALTLRVFVILSACAVIGGALFGFNH